MDNVFFQNAKDFLLELFFPSFCLGCQKEGVFLCQDCKATLEISEYNYCLCSKNPIRLPSSNKNGKCQRCKERKLVGLYSALAYKERFLTRRLIHQFKYSPHLKSLSKTLADILVEHLILAKDNAEDIWENSILVPIPLEKGKLRSRGYNQSEELARELSIILKVPVVTNVLFKVKSTPPQMQLPKEAREKNLEKAFLVKNFKEAAEKKIFLVDDVYTTGSTMEECAKVLKEAGVKQVWGIVIAREG